MVRLKGKSMNYVEQTNPISIPYGSIKRSSLFALSIAKAIFQFLMVRLKAVPHLSAFYPTVFQFLMVRLKVWLNTCSATFGIFQFLMVRLKEPNRLPIATIIEISIPYGSIKRQIPTAFSAASCADNPSPKYLVSNPSS